MKHPSEQEWMEFLYEEMPSGQRKAVKTHIKGCAPCQQRQSELQGTTARLKAWKVQAPARHEFAPTVFPVAKWAAAAALLFTTAFAAGRWSKPPLNPADIETQITLPLREKIERSVQARMEAIFQTKLTSRLQELSERTAAESIAANKKQLEQIVLQLAALRDEDKKAFFASLQELETRRVSDLRRMREDLEKVALFSDESSRDTQRKLGELASLAINTP